MNQFKITIKKKQQQQQQRPLLKNSYTIKI